MVALSQPGNNYRWRSNGEQSIKVQHIAVSDGGQAIVGSTLQTGGYEKIEHRPHEKRARGPALLEAGARGTSQHCPLGVRDR
jgi:hypothetical protein